MIDLIKKVMYDYKEATYSASDLVAYVQNNLKEPCNFMIAGGSLADIKFNKKFGDINDIDIFFYNKEDYESFNRNLKGHSEASKTNNAITYEKDGILIQPIHKFFGDVQDVLNSFDLNQSKLLITSDYQQYDFTGGDMNVSIDYKNYSNATPQRLIKYKLKGFTLRKTELETLVDFQLEKRDEVYKNTYDNTEKLGIVVFETFVHAFGAQYVTVVGDKNNKHLENWMQFVYLKLKPILNDTQIIEFYKSFGNYILPNMYQYDLYCLAMIESMNSQLWDFDTNIDDKIIEKLGEDNYLRTKIEYPEYFV